METFELGGERMRLDRMLLSSSRSATEEHGNWIEASDQRDWEERKKEDDEDKECGRKKITTFSSYKGSKTKQVNCLFFVGCLFCLRPFC